MGIFSRCLIGYSLVMSVGFSFAQNMKSEWVAALSSAYKTGAITDGEDGITTFTACFNATEGKKQRCHPFALVRRDGFKGNHLYTTFLTEKSVDLNYSFLGNAIGVVDCEKPLYLLRLQHVSENGWLFMNKVSVMLNGEVIYEDSFKSQNVTRTVQRDGVLEKILLPVEENDLPKLRKIASGGKVVIRINGEKGYFSIPPKEAQTFSKDVSDGLEIYDALNLSLASMPNTTCSRDR